MRAFILGNSGELLDHDLTRLQGEAVFGVNALPLREPDIITHYVCGDMAMAFLPEIRAIVPKTAKKYYSRLMWNTIYQEDNVNVYDVWDDRSIGFEISDTKVFFCQTVTYAALQIAAALGYNPIYIMGVDLGAPANGIMHIPEQRILTGMMRYKNLADVTIDKRWTPPSIEQTGKRTNLAFTLARSVLEKASIEVFNLSKGGNLTAFPRKVFEEVVSNHQTGVVPEVEPIKEKLYA